MDASVAQAVGLALPVRVSRSGIWESARAEFSRRGYHGARVQGIARGAACNVALMYRHWASKRALYVDILRAVWIAAGERDRAARLEDGSAASDAVVVAYVDAMMADPTGAQILIREYLDGAPFLATARLDRSVHRGAAPPRRRDAPAGTRARASTRCSRS